MVSLATLKRRLLRYGLGRATINEPPVEEVVRMISTEISGVNRDLGVVNMKHVLLREHGVHVKRLLFDADF